MQEEYYQPGEKVNWFDLPTQYAFNMKQQKAYRWWKPIVALFVALFFFLTFAVVITLPIEIASNFTYFDTIDASDIAAGDFSDYQSALKNTSDPANPLAYGFGLVSLVILIPAFGLAMKIFGLGGLGGLSSFKGKLRWDRILAFFPWTLLVAFVLAFVTLAVDIAMGDTDLATLRFLPVTIVVVLILAPLQSAAEEYVFRGFCLQAFSSWIPVIVIPVVLQALIFGSMHSQYNILGIIGVGTMGFFAGYVTCKTGGIEGGICIHASNNLVAMLMSCFFATAEAGYDITIIALISDFVFTSALTAIVLWRAKQKGYLLKKSADTVQEDAIEAM